MTCGLYSKNVSIYCICMCNGIIHYVTVLRGEGIYVLSLVAQSYPTLCKTMDCNTPGSSVHRDSADKNTGVGCHALFRGLFPTQGLNLGFLRCRWIFYQLSYQKYLVILIIPIKTFVREPLSKLRRILLYLLIQNTCLKFIFIFMWF